MEWYQLSVEEVLHREEVKPTSGLSAIQAQERLTRIGPNILEKGKTINPFMLFLNQFNNFVVWILLGAVIISFVIHEVVDATVILVILVFNAIFGFIQEYKAEKAIEALKKMASLKANVIRDGKELQIETEHVVPGDILLLEEGTKVSADARLIEAINLSISEAALTGESVPSSKKTDLIKDQKGVGDQNNMVFSGTSVVRGRGKAVVVATAMQTQLGKIAKLISSVEEELTPLQKKLEELGKWLGIATIIICMFVSITQIVIHHDNWLEALIVGVSLAVAAIPEGLPAVVTISLAIGVRKMVKRNALIRKLPAVETLGSTSIICSDKTGTLTKNEMTVRKVWIEGKVAKVSGDGYERKGELDKKNGISKDGLVWMSRASVLCNNAALFDEDERTKVRGDPTEGALLVSAIKMGEDLDKLKNTWKRLEEMPFDSERKLMSTINSSGKNTIHFLKGAPEKVLDACDRIFWAGKMQKLTPEKRKQVIVAQEEMAKDALRVLGFAYKSHKGKAIAEKNMVFIGLQGMIDPPRPEVKPAIEKCAKAGIRVIMITGDHKLTAMAVAKEIGIKGDALEGSEIEKLSLDEMVKVVLKVSVYARVDPSHKLKIVEALQKDGKFVVAMTGDGVNDAPAIKKANMGIAMGITGTDVTKEASDMILLDDNFASIVNAVEEGRGIYENIHKFVNYLLSCNLGEVFIIFFAIVMGWDLPLTAIMLLWLNLVTDGLPALALGVDPSSPDIMNKPPRDPHDKLMSRSFILMMGTVSLLITVGTLGLFQWAYTGPQSLMYAQTIAFTTVIIMELVRIYAIRSEYNLSPFSNKWLILAVASSLGLQLLVIYTPLQRFFGTVPLGLKEWGLILGTSTSVLLLSILIRTFKRKIWNQPFHE